MNERIHHDDTSEGRIAAVAKSLCIRMEAQSKKPDYADFRDALRPFIKRELLIVQIEEARRVSGRALTARVKELAEELLALVFPDEYNL